MKRSTDTRHFWRTRAIILVSVAALACQGTPKQPPRASDGLTATILIYSGRPNPRFVLKDAAAITRVASIISDAAVSDFKGTTVTPSRLGYAGITIDNPGRLGDLPVAFAVYKGNIGLHGAETRFLRDGDGALEKYLLGQARKRRVIGDREIKIIQGD